MEPDEVLFGLYQGTPLTERGSQYGNTLPDRISIYQRPIEEASEDEEEIRASVAETLIHEFGHHFWPDRGRNRGDRREGTWRGT